MISAWIYIFSLYINEVVDGLFHTTPHQFVEDPQLYKDANIDNESLDQAVIQINDDMSRVHYWYIYNRLGIL